MPVSPGEVDLLARGRTGLRLATDAPLGLRFENVLEGHRSRVRWNWNASTSRPVPAPDGAGGGVCATVQRTHTEGADSRTARRLRIPGHGQGLAEERLACSRPRRAAPASGERRVFLEFVFPLLDVLRDSIDPDLALHHLEGFAASSGNRISFLRALASRRPHLSRLTNLLAYSRLSHRILSRHPEFFDSLARGIHLHEGRTSSEMLQELLERFGAAPKREPRDLLLRRYRQREMVRVAYRDMAGLAGAVEISRELSDLAEACVLTALDVTRPHPMTFSGRTKTPWSPSPAGSWGAGRCTMLRTGSALFLPGTRRISVVRRFSGSASVEPRCEGRAPGRVPDGGDAGRRGVRGRSEASPARARRACWRGRGRASWNTHGGSCSRGSGWR